jgi:hypothetical protein
MAVAACIAAHAKGGEILVCLRTCSAPSPIRLTCNESTGKPQPPSHIGHHAEPRSLTGGPPASRIGDRVWLFDGVGGFGVAVENADREVAAGFDQHVLMLLVLYACCCDEELAGVRDSCDFRDSGPSIAIG